jgi:glutathione synthase/RimK-type ligase-like ATP-grasp enzyme
MFYLHCVKHNLPVPETFLIPRIGYNREKISSLFEKSPLVLKASMSQSGSAVEKADNMEEFEKYWKKMAAGNPESSIVAQEYIADGNGNGDKYKSYRVLLAGGKILQAVAKYGKSWKITGYEDSEHFRQFDIDSDLKDICEKAAKVLGMDLCGVDLINKNGKWYIIEVNSNPGFDFIESDKKRLVSDVADYLADVFKATIVKK